MFEQIGVGLIVMVLILAVWFLVDFFRADSYDIEPPDRCPDCGSEGMCAAGCPSRLP